MAAVNKHLSNKDNVDTIVNDTCHGGPAPGYGKKVLHVPAYQHVVLEHCPLSSCPLMGMLFWRELWREWPLWRVAE